MATEDRTPQEGRRINFPSIEWSPIGFLLLLILIVMGAICTHYVDQHIAGYAVNMWTGERKVLKDKGLFFFQPFIRVHEIDTTPKQLCISNIGRTLNCKLVHFDMQGLDTFVSWHKAKDFIHGEGAEESEFDLILKNYAYADDGVTYPFLVIDAEIRGARRSEAQHE